MSTKNARALIADSGRAGRQRRGAADYHAQHRSGGKPSHLGKRNRGYAETLHGRQSDHALRTVHGLLPRQGRNTGDSESGGRHRARHLRRFPEGTTPAMISRERNLTGVPCSPRRSLLSEKKEAIAKAQKKTARRRTSTVENAQTNQIYKGTPSGKKRTARIIF